MSYEYNPRWVGEWMNAHCATCLYGQDGSLVDTEEHCPNCEHRDDVDDDPRSLSRDVRTALSDVLRCLTDDTVIVTGERVEAWKAALEGGAE